MLLLNLLLALAWVGITGTLTVGTFAEGFIVSFVILWLVTVGNRPTYFRLMWQRITFLPYFCSELVKSNAKVAYEIITPTHYLRPAIVRVPIEGKSPEQITLLANVITLTPSTLTLDISPDRKWLYVHMMYVEGTLDEARQELLDGLGRRVEGMFE